MRTAAPAILLAAAIRVLTGFAPVAAAALVGVIAVAASAHGVWANGRVHVREWRLAWAALGLGLVGVACVGVIQALQRSAGQSESGVLMGLSVGSGVVAALGLVSLIRQRLPGRATEALAEAVVAGLTPGLRRTRLGWRQPGRRRTGRSARWLAREQRKGTFVADALIVRMH